MGKGRIVEGLSSGEGLIWQVRDPIWKTKRNEKTKQTEEVLDDPGVEDKRLLVLESELATPMRAMQREGNTLSAVLRRAWDAGDLRVLTKNSPARATDAHISVIGHTTREELVRLLSTTEAANGFANRFVWLCTRRSKVLPEGGQFDQENIGPPARQFAEAHQFAQELGDVEIKRDEEARAVWHEVYPELSSGKPGLLGAVVGRGEAQTMRFALLYALLDRSRVIQRVHLEAALALWDYAEASARHIFGDSLGDPVADEIHRALKNAGDGLTRTDIRDLFGRNRKQAEISRALGSLLERDLVTVAKVETNGRRPTEVWKLR